jgi:anti-sigma regulatory factor (Ser/Thr protein kinase)
MGAIPVSQVRTGYEGFERILEMWGNVSLSGDSEHTIQLTGWTDANMCAPLGALLTWLREEGRVVSVSATIRETTRILQKNHFLTQFGAEALRDWYPSTIEYRAFRTDNASGEEFWTYVAESFRPGVRGLPSMSKALTREFRKSVFELYLNAVEHAESRLGVFTCGQYYPRKHRLDFTIADLGMGIRRRVLLDRKESMSPEQAIEWAVSGNTTKTGRLPGGLGLQLIKEFIGHNNGRLIIVSDAGYWQQAGRLVEKRLFPRPFPGTVVTIEVNTADTAAYCLKSEIREDEIF